MVRITRPDPESPSQPGPETQYQYDKAGNLRFVIDALGNVTEMVYDNRDRLVEIVLPDPGGQGSPRITYTYDAAGQRPTPPPTATTTSIAAPASPTRCWKSPASSSTRPVS